MFNKLKEKIRKQKQPKKEFKDMTPAEKQKVFREFLWGLIFVCVFMSLISLVNMAAYTNLEERVRDMERKIDVFSYSGSNYEVNLLGIPGLDK